MRLRLDCNVGRSPGPRARWEQTGHGPRALGPRSRGPWREALWVGLACVLGVAAVAGGASTGEEYQVKAAFLYNFMRFTAWPPERTPAPGEPWVVGVVGRDPFGPRLDAITHKTHKNHPLAVRRFPGIPASQPDAPYPDLDAIRACHLVFVADTETAHFASLLPALASASVLTVGESPRFLEAGGIIAFALEASKVRFRIHQTHAREAHLEIRAKLLRLALEVLQ